MQTAPPSSSPLSSQKSAEEQDEPHAPLITLEAGELRIYARPRVQIKTVRSFSDVQKLLLTLSAEGRADELSRRFHIGKKRLPNPKRRERGWGYIDRVGDLGTIHEELSRSRTYETKTRGLREQNAALEVAGGTYRIASHRDHVHLLFTITRHDEGVTDSLLASLNIVPFASYIAAVFNPLRKDDPRDGKNGSSDGPQQEEEDVPFREPSIFDDEEEEERASSFKAPRYEITSSASFPAPRSQADPFAGKKFAPLAPAFLNTEGAEIVLIGDPLTQCAPFG